jgi:type II secretory pathway component PulM
MKYWYNLTLREQIALIILTVFVGIFLIYVLMVMPLIERNEQSLLALNNEKARYNRIMQMAQTTRSTSSQPSINSIPSTPLRDAATSASRQTGVAISRIQPEADNSVTFWIDKAGTLEMMNWLVLLRSQYGYNATKVTIQKNSGEDTLRGQFKFKGENS